MIWLKSNFVIVFSCLWILGLFLGVTYGQAFWYNDFANPVMEPSSEIIIPRGLYQPSFEVAFEGENRDLWQKPDQVMEEVIKTLGPLIGMKIADIGCGEGYFTKRLAREVGDAGRVFASDIQKEVLDRMISSLDPEIAGQVVPILANEESLGIPEPVDLVFLVQVLGEVPNQRQFLEQILEIMKPGAKLVLIDSKHITDPNTGYARPQNLSRLLSELEKEGLITATAPLQFLPKQFFFILKGK